jgi:GDSL-like Lipase/Acylhydrolase family
VVGLLIAVRRTARLLAALALGGTVLVAPGRAAALPASYFDDPTPRPAGSMAIVGDSLAVGYWAGLDDAVRQAGFGPFRMEARSARRSVVAIEGSTSGIDAIRHIRNDGFDARVWVVALGTNDINLTANSPGEPDRTITTVLDEIGPGHLVVWVNVHAGRSAANAASFNARLATIAAQRGDMHVADWATLAAANPDWIREDGVHNTARGAVERNRFVAAQALWAATTRPAPPAHRAGTPDPPVALLTPFRIRRR